jgi:hypothetical protein
MLTTIKNMLTALPLLKQFLALWGEVATAVHQVEATGVSGADKRALALKVVTDLCNGFGSILGLAVPTANIVSIVGILIDTVVFVENALGRFTHASAPAATAPAAPVTATSAPLVQAPTPVAQINAPALVTVTPEPNSFNPMAGNVIG